MYVQEYAVITEDHSVNENSSLLTADIILEAMSN